MGHFPFPKLELHLLGAPQISDNGVVRTERPSAKAQALLYYLAMTASRGHLTQTRTVLTSLLWGEYGESDARSSLRKAIHQLREHFDPYLAIDHHTVGFQSALVYWVDAVEFATQIADTRVANPEHLQPTLALYRGDFLEGFYVREAPAFETWMLSERARLRELMLQGLATLAEWHADGGDLPLAIATARRLLELEPWREEIHRQLMEWLTQNGQWSTALAQYEICCRALAEELDVEPSRATRELYERLQRQDSSAQTLQTAHRTPTEYALVGRGSAWQTLRSAWHKTLQAGTQLVCITGEAGIGKTRLAEELLLYTHRQGHATARTRAYALEGRLAYAPLADWLRSTTLQSKVAKLDPVWLSEVARLLPELLIQHPDLPAPQPLTERWQQKRLFEALLHAFTTDSPPLLLLLDDLQWCDPETLAWLHYLLEVAPQAPLLVVGTARSEEVDEGHPLHKLGRTLLHAGKLTTIELAPLNAEETAALGAQVRKHALDGQAATRLYQETAGNPLFVVESVRAELSRGAEEQGTGFALEGSSPKGGEERGAGVDFALPPKVYAVIQSRLAQLSPAARMLAQWAATVGRAFSVVLLMQASQLDEETVVRGLDELWRRRIVREQAIGSYDFSHDRIRDVAYAESSPVKRSLFHQHVAQALEKIHASNLDPVAGELAVHYQRAGALEQAILYRRQAGAVARQLFANQEAVNHWTKALELLKSLPVTPERIQQQLDVLCVLGPAVINTKSFHAPEVAEVYRQAQALCRQGGDTSRLFTTLLRMAGFYQACGDMRASLELAEQCLTLAQASKDPALLNAAHIMLGEDLLYLGELSRAKTHLEQALNYHDPKVHDSMTSLFGGMDPVVGVLGPLCLCLWLLGHIDRALQCSQAAFARGQQMSDPFNRALGSNWAGIHHACRQDWQIGLTRLEEPFAIAAQWEIGAMLMWQFKGWMLARQDRIAQGLALMQRGVVPPGTVTTFTPMQMAPLAETYGRVGRVDEGLAVIEEALTITQRTGDAFWNAELYRLRGELLSIQGTDEQAVEACYWQAIQIARQQNAKSLELRAVMRLARLWQRQRRVTEAHQRLAEIYSWFTEGFDTVDLQEAQALLEELQAAAPHK